MLNASLLHPCPWATFSSFSALLFTQPAGFPTSLSNESRLLLTTLNCEFEVCTPTPCDVTVVAEAASWTGDLERWNNCTRIVSTVREGELKGKGTYLLKDVSTALALSLLCVLHPVADADELSVDVLERGDDTVLDGLADLLLDEASSEGAEGLVEEVVLGVADGEL